MDVPDIRPDFNGPGTEAIRQILSWTLGLALLVALLALIVCLLLIIFKGFGNQRAQQFAASHIIWVALGVAALGSVNGLFALFMGFDLGL